jgi:hypothetical protein
MTILGGGDDLIIVRAWYGGPHNHSGQVHHGSSLEHGWLWQTGDRKGVDVTAILLSSVRNGELNFNPERRGCNDLFGFGHEWQCHKVLVVQYKYGESGKVQTWFSESVGGEPYHCFLPASPSTPEQIAIALDIGGTNIKACFRARGSELLTWLEKIPTNAAFTDKTTNTEAVAAVCARLQSQLQAKGLHLCHATKLAISFAGPIDLKTGHVLKAYNLGGERHEGDLAAEFHNHLISTYKPLSGGFPYLEPVVHIMNDALAPALAVVRTLQYSHVSPAWAKLRAILPEHAHLPVLCLSLGTSVGVSAIHQAPDGEIQIILPETWGNAKFPTRAGDTCIWQALGAGADSLSSVELKQRLLRDDGALACLLRMYQAEPSLGPSPRTIIFIGGRSQSLLDMNGTTWQGAQGAEPILLAVPKDVNELAVIGALSYGVSPIEVRVRRVAVIAGLEASGSEVFLGSKA